MRYNAKFKRSLMQQNVCARLTLRITNVRSMFAWFWAVLYILRRRIQINYKKDTGSQEELQFGKTSLIKITINGKE